MLGPLLPPPHRDLPPPPVNPLLETLSLCFLSLACTSSENLLKAPSAPICARQRSSAGAQLDLTQTQSICSLQPRESWCLSRARSPARVFVFILLIGSATSISLTGAQCFYSRGSEHRGQLPPLARLSMASTGGGVSRLPPVEASRFPPLRTQTSVQASERTNKQTSGHTRGNILAGGAPISPAQINLIEASPFVMARVFCCVVLSSRSLRCPSWRPRLAVSRHHYHPSA